MGIQHVIEHTSETISCCTVPQSPLPPWPLQPSLPVDTVDLRYWESVDLRKGAAIASQERYLWLQ